MITARKMVAIASVVLGACLLIGLVYFGQFWYEGVERQRSTLAAQSALDNLHVGMTRVETRSLVQDAWRHYSCYDETIEVYLFGSRNPDLAKIVILVFDSSGDSGRLARISSDENYRLFMYEQCSTPNK